MIVGWKYRTTFENAHDSFDKIAKFQKEAGADWVITSITTGGDNGSFITAVGFENMQAYGKMDDMWNAPDSKMDEMMAANLSKSEGIETYSMNTLVGNIEGDQPNTVFANWIFECDDQQAVKDSHELDWKYYKEGGCSGIDIHQMKGGDYASNGAYMFVARFNSMEQLGSCMDHMWSKSDYMKSSADYHSKIKIIKNFNARVLRSERFK